MLPALVGMGFFIPTACLTASAGFAAQPQGFPGIGKSRPIFLPGYAASGSASARAAKYVSSGVFQPSE